MYVLRWLDCGWPFYFCPKTRPFTVIIYPFPFWGRTSLFMLCCDVLCGIRLQLKWWCTIHYTLDHINRAWDRERERKKVTWRMKWIWLKSHRKLRRKDSCKWNSPSPSRFWIDSHSFGSVSVNGCIARSYATRVRFTHTHTQMIQMNTVRNDNNKRKPEKSYFHKMEMDHI